MWVIIGLKVRNASPVSIRNWLAAQVNPAQTWRRHSRNTVLLQRQSAVTPVEYVHRVHDFQRAVLEPRFTSNLHQTACIGGDDQIRPRLGNVAHLSLAEAAGHFWFGQVIGSRSTTAEFRFGKFFHVQPRDLL